MEMLRSNLNKVKAVLVIFGILTMNACSSSTEKDGVVDSADPTEIDNTSDNNKDVFSLKEAYSGEVMDKVAPSDPIEPDSLELKNQELVEITDLLIGFYEKYNEVMDLLIQTQLEKKVDETVIKLSQKNKDKFNIWQIYYNTLGEIDNLDRFGEKELERIKIEAKGNLSDVKDAYEKVKIELDELNGEEAER